MSTVRIALANAPVPNAPEESLAIAVEMMATASELGAAVVCFPESFLPGYRIGSDLPPCNVSFLKDAWREVDQAARQANIAVILGTERLEGENLLITTRVTNANGAFVGFQDKVQLDPSEEGVYSPGAERRVFQCGDLTFGIVICHEGWRYPETVRWAVRQGAHIVFHPHTEIVEDARFRPAGFADPRNSFHEKAALCRAAENTCYFATVNHALPGAATTSAVVDPNGKLLVHQPHGQYGVLVADIDIARATGFLARRLRTKFEADRIVGSIFILGLTAAELVESFCTPPLV